MYLLSHTIQFRNWTLDRINNDFGHTYDNCVPACFQCDVKRNNMPYRKFYRIEALKRFDKIKPLIHIVNEENELVFEKLKANICGGLSLVFHRYHEKDITKIQRCEYTNQKTWKLAEEGNTVKKMGGFDANALYLWCLGEEMPCGKLEYIPLSKINLDNFFGFLEVDIEVPEHLYNYYSEFPPIIKNFEYSDEICGDYTSKMVKNLWGKHSTSRKLIATFKGEKVLIKSTRLKWLLNHGCVITWSYTSQTTQMF